jgi:hypothetical protein
MGRGTLALFRVDAVLAAGVPAEAISAALRARPLGVKGSPVCVRNSVEFIRQRRTSVSRCVCRTVKNKHLRSSVVDGD